MASQLRRRTVEAAEVAGFVLLVALLVALLVGLVVYGLHLMVGTM